MTSRLLAYPFNGFSDIGALASLASLASKPSCMLVIIVHTRYTNISELSECPGIYHLDHIVPPTSRCARVTIRGSNGPLLQQPHQFTHSGGDRDFGLALDQNIQFGILAGARLLASCVETALRGDRCTGGFQDLGNVCAVGNGPTSFFCIEIRILAAVQ